MSSRTSFRVRSGSIRKVGKSAASYIRVLEPRKCRRRPVTAGARYRLTKRTMPPNRRPTGAVFTSKEGCYGQSLEGCCPRDRAVFVSYAARSVGTSALRSSMSFGRIVAHLSRAETVRGISALEKPDGSKLPSCLIGHVCTGTERLMVGRFEGHKDFSQL